MKFGWKYFWYILVVLFVLTLPFWFWDIDLAVQRAFFDAEQGGWYMHTYPFWNFIYKFGIFPGLLIALVSLFLVAFSYWRSSYLRFRKPALLLVLALVLGPGLLVNVILKDNYGRPRPREVVEFGGTESFVPILIPSDAGGKSFPCGHGAIGFYLAIPFLFLYPSRKLLAWVSLGAGLIFGTLLSLARIMAGGHFTSDAIWAAGLVFLMGILAARLVKIEVPSKEASRRQASRMSLVMGIALPVITVGLLLATPYISSKTFDLNAADLEQLQALPVQVELEDANIKIERGEELIITYQANCFGFPNSRIRPRWEESTSTYQLEQIGWFTEVGLDFTISLPEQLPLKIKLERGTVLIDQSISEKQLFIEKGEEVRLVVK